MGILFLLPFLHNWQHILSVIAGCQCSCKLRHRAFGTCTFYASETRINTGFLKVLLQNAQNVHDSTLFFLPCRTLQKAHKMGNCAIASLSSADYAAGRKKGIRGGDALRALGTAETPSLASAPSPLRYAPRLLLRKWLRHSLAPANVLGTFSGVPFAGATVCATPEL